MMMWSNHFYTFKIDGNNEKFGQSKQYLKTQLDVSLV